MSTVKTWMVLTITRLSVPIFSSISAYDTLTPSPTTFASLIHMSRGMLKIVTLLIYSLAPI